MVCSKDTDLAKRVIEELGGVSVVARLCKIAPSSVCLWKETGLPQAREMFFRVAYPNLKAWTETKA